jgi:hypothetical protein
MRIAGDVARTARIAIERYEVTPKVRRRMGELAAEQIADEELGIVYFGNREEPEKAFGDNVERGLIHGVG